MTWGSPAAVSFEKRHIRMVVVDHHRVKVHRSLAAVVERILLDLAEQGLTAETEGWTFGGDGRRVKVVVDGLNSDKVGAVMSKYGFVGTKDVDWFAWSESQPPDEADAYQEVPPVSKPVSPSQSSKVSIPKAPVGTQKLGERALELGDEGMDVLTLQVFLGAPRTGKYDAETMKVVHGYHSRKGFASDGSMPLASQAWIIPRTVERLRTGAAGLTVLLLTSALIGRQVLGRDFPLTPRYTVELADVVREYRYSIGLPKTEVVDSPTWASLVGQPRR